VQTWCSRERSGSAKIASISALSSVPSPSRSRLGNSSPSRRHWKTMPTRSASSSITRNGIGMPRRSSGLASTGPVSSTTSGSSLLSIRKGCRVSRPLTSGPSETSTRKKTASSSFSRSTLVSQKNEITTPPSSLVTVAIPAGKTPAAVATDQASGGSLARRQRTRTSTGSEELSLTRRRISTLPDDSSEFEGSVGLGSSERTSGGSFPRPSCSVPPGIGPPPGLSAKTLTSLW
jgi:hypothetical protein